MNKLIFTVLFALSIMLFSSTHSNANTVTPPHTQKQMLTINVNQADVNELLKLKGVGESKAKAIIAYRELNGRFKSLDDLIKVKGIGAKILADNLAQISI